LVNLFIISGIVKLIEPTIITKKYWKGGFLESYDFIPSSTLTGGIISYINRNSPKPSNEKELLKLLKERNIRIWISHAFPYEGDKIDVLDPLPLPISTVAIAENTEYVSYALLIAKYHMGEKELIKRISRLNFKVPRGFFLIKNDRAVMFKVKDWYVYTHVALDHERRTAAEKLLYTIESLNSGNSFAFKGVLDEATLDEIKGGLEIRLGMKKSAGYGLSKVEICDYMPISKYIEKRAGQIGKFKEKIVTVDVVTYSYVDRILSLKMEMVFHKMYVSNEKAFVINKFNLYKNVIHPGSVFVFKRDKDPYDLAKIEVSLPSDPFEMIHGLNMLYFNNPFHFKFSIRGD